jgi:hypothetical protein
MASLFPPRESLVVTSPGWGRETRELFFTVYGVHKKDEPRVSSLKLTLIILYYENNMNTCVGVGAILWKILKNMQYAETF